MRYSTDKDIQTLVTRLLRSGCHFEKGRHGKLRPPIGKGFVTIPCTPSDRRSFQNFRRDIRRLERGASSPSQGIGAHDYLSGEPGYSVRQELPGTESNHAPSYPAQSVPPD